MHVLSLQIHEVLAITMSQVKHSYPITNIYLSLLILELGRVEIMLIIFKSRLRILIIEVHFRNQLVQGIQAQIIAKQNHLEHIMLK